MDFRPPARSLGFCRIALRSQRGEIASGFTPNSNSAGDLKMDGTGDFEYGVNCTVCGNGASNPQQGPLDFTITGGSGLSTASFEKNADGQFFAVDIISPVTGKTGGVDASTSVVSTPDGGATLVLLGLGCWDWAASTGLRQHPQDESLSVCSYLPLLTRPEHPWMMMRDTAKVNWCAFCHTFNSRKSFTARSSWISISPLSDDHGCRDQHRRRTDGNLLQAVRQPAGFCISLIRSQPASRAKNYRVVHSN